ncbi:hypothetical protein J1N35_019027, partial [Gossypium stocksii]
GLDSPYQPYGRPIVIRDDPCNPKENFRILGPHACVAHMPVCHTPATTQLCLTSGHTIVDHTAISSHRAIHTSDHMPMWHRQNCFSTFVEALFSMFQRCSSPTHNLHLTIKSTKHQCNHMSLTQTRSYRGVKFTYQSNKEPETRNINDRMKVSQFESRKRQEIH